jgi:hypothetical protein
VTALVVPLNDGRDLLATDPDELEALRTEARAMGIEQEIIPDGYANGHAVYRFLHRLGSTTISMNAAGARNHRAYLRSRR